MLSEGRFSMVDTTWFGCSGIIAAPVSEGRAHLLSPPGEETMHRGAGGQEGACCLVAVAGPTTAQGDDC
ncbi:hypothetical protein FKM82_020083 [Ascaphus truei]